VTTTRRRVLVIGLDGGTFDLIEPWAAAGHLPNLARLMAQGCRGRLASTLQPVTAPAWTTFMTGVNQGKHGLYDFVRRRSAGYHLEVTNASHAAAPTIFDIASQSGRRVVAVNIPYTFPPRPVNGVMIGGPFVPAVTCDLISPPDYFDVLKSVAPGYFVLPDYAPRAADPLGDYADKLLTGVALRERLSLHLLHSEPWDLFTVVFMATDEAQHAYWHCRVDQAIGSILDQVAADGQEDETLVVIMSDHGAGPLRWMINLNRWLAEAGYLSFHKASASPLRQLRAAATKRLAQLYLRYVPAKARAAIRTQLGAQRFDQLKGDFESALLTSTVDWERTRAYALGAGGNIFINLQGREPAGIVQPGAEYERLRQELVQALAALSDPETGAPIVQRVYRREELYHGPFLDQAPDLVIQWRDYACWGRGRYDSQGTAVFEAQRHFDFSDLPLSGTHRPQGILLLQGAGVRPGTQIEGARILDLAPTILGALGLPIPEHLDGTVLHAAFVEGAIESTAPLATDATVPAAGDEFAYTPEETAQISQRLQDLGYL
jgi:predicted AlkP superfamily phosphohydrolase/phosphomutase